MQRRDFIRNLIAAGAFAGVGGSRLFARPLGGRLVQPMGSASDNILVLINLNGGNDSLNMVVPFNDQAYYDNRPTLALKKGQTLPIDSNFGFHNMMPEMQAQYLNGNLAIVNNVGYTGQDRSHFRSTDIWHTASKSDQFLQTGWAGRYLETVHSDYPTTLPDAPFAVQVSSSTTLLIQGERGNLGMAIDNPAQFYDLANGLKPSTDPIPNTVAGNQLEYIEQIMRESDRYSTSIQTALQAGKNYSTYESDILSEQMQLVARLISGGLKTNLYIVTLAGFDTHYSQAAQHADLLGQLSKALGAFFDDIYQSKNVNRVVCMTYSEFGRRLAENGSVGTDHGAAGAQLVFGGPVLGGAMLGGIPNLSELDARGDIQFTVDYQQLYATVLEDWLGFSHTDTVNVLGGDYAKLPLFANKTVSAPDTYVATSFGVSLEQNSPNPARTLTTVRYVIPQASIVRITVSDVNGTRVMAPIEQLANAGRNDTELDISRLASGNYFYSIEALGERIVKRMTVVR